MTALALKKELHKAIDNIDDTEFLKAVYTIINEKNQAEVLGISEKQWEEIEHRVKLHKKGSSKSYTLAETIKFVKSQIKK